MYEGFYEKPRYRGLHTPVRIACVVPAYIPVGQKKDYGHYVEDKLETIQMNLNAHAHYKPGIPYDLLLYDNSSPDTDGREFLRSHGAIRRENEGFSFGAWKEAWDSHGRSYDFYLFTEDDIAPTRDGWLLEIFQQFFSAENIGAVGNFVEGRGPEESMSDKLWKLMKHEHDMMYNFDGAFTFTSSLVLQEVEQIGGLPVFSCEPKTDLPATVNECVFQQPILQLGYRIVSFDDDEHCVVHGSEIFSGDIQHRDKLLAPLVNLNGRRNIPKVAENFAWLIAP